jgi:hypothetical protein
MRNAGRPLALLVPFAVLVVSLALASPAIAGRTVNPPPPITPEEAAGVWIGMDEVYQGLYVLALNPDGSGLLAYTPPRSDDPHTDLYRLTEWEQNHDKVKLQAMPVGAGSGEVKIKGKVRRRSIRLEVKQKGGDEHRVQLIREEEFDAAVERVRAALTSADRQP